MTSIQVSDIAVFMKYFLATDTFDFLNTIEANISTYCDFHIDGRQNKKYFDTDNVPTEEFATWGKLRPLCYDLIKGKTLPLKMSFLLLLPKSTSKKLLEGNGYMTNSDAVDLLINVRYENGQVNLITGSNTQTFLLDKSYDDIWDREFIKQISKYNF